jgi:hypothetical protein
MKLLADILANLCQAQVAFADPWATCKIDFSRAELIYGVADFYNDCKLMYFCVAPGYIPAGRSRNRKEGPSPPLGQALLAPLSADAGRNVAALRMRRFFTRLSIAFRGPRLLCVGVCASTGASSLATGGVAFVGCPRPRGTFLCVF